MEHVILVIHLLLAIGLVGVVLLQRSEGGGLGIGGGGGMGGLATAKGTANLLTRATGLCAFAFFCTSLILGILAGQSSQPVGLLESLEQNEPLPIETLEVQPEEPEAPAEPPEVPVAN